MEEANKVSRLIELCEKELKEDIVDYGIFTGYSGLALYFFEKNKISGSSESISKFEYYLKKSIKGLEENKAFSLCSGNIGIYYLIFYLIKNEYYDDKVEVIFQEFPDYAEELIEYYSERKNFDYLHGFLGILFLCLELYSFSKEPIFKEKIKKPIINIVYLLDSLSLQLTPDKISWISKGLYSKTEGFSFGFAHGIPSIVSLLTRVYYLGVEKKNIKNMLERACNFLISVKGEYDGSCFPNFIMVRNNERIPTSNSRLAWCYGDLSVGIALLNCGKVIENKNIIKEADEILLNTTKREYSKTGIVDVFLCHGTSGLVMMYNYLYKVTGKEIYKERTDFWLNDTIIKSQQNYPNIKTWIGSEGGWTDQDSILEGKSGLLLQLYSIIDKEYENPLEKLFLLNYED